jgi:hypothetical protein
VRLRAIAILALGLSVSPGLVAPTTAAGQEVEVVPIDTASLADGPYARVCTLLERTIFKVDVLTLRIRFGEETARRLAELASGEEYSDALADSVARVAVRARDAYAEIEFVRGVSLGQFVDGVRDDLGKAREAGIIDSADYRMISEGLPRWFDFLSERGIREGDRILYRIRGDTLRTVFHAEDGAFMLDQTDVGPERRLAVLGSYFAPGSSFREGLVRSLFTRRDRGRRPQPSGASSPGPTVGSIRSPKLAAHSWAAARFASYGARHSSGMCVRQWSAVISESPTPRSTSIASPRKHVAAPASIALTTRQSRRA